MDLRMKQGQQTKHTANITLFSNSVMLENKLLENKLQMTFGLCSELIHHEKGSATPSGATA